MPLRNWAHINGNLNLHSGCAFLDPKLFVANNEVFCGDWEYSEESNSIIARLINISGISYWEPISIPEKTLIINSIKVYQFPEEIGRNIQKPVIYDILYGTGNGLLWFLKDGIVKNVVLSKKRNNYIVPLVYYNGNLYAASYNRNPSIWGVFDSDATFDIIRSKDINETRMVWEKVVNDGFDNCTNNHALGAMIIFKSKLYAITDLTFFLHADDPSYYGTGIEVWESVSGDKDTWHQVNEDGFGSCVGTPPDIYNKNQAFGCAEVFQNHLYIGTLSVQSGEVWRYDGSGLSGWEDVSPYKWQIPSYARIIFPEYWPVAMTVYNNKLYVAESVPNASIRSFRETNPWQVEVPGPHPFNLDNIRFCSLVANNNTMFAATAGPTGGISKGQIWYYQFKHR